MLYATIAPQTAYTSGLRLAQLDAVQETIAALEERMAQMFQPTA